jgi:hypothetical protein
MEVIELRLEPKMDKKEVDTLVSRDETRTEEPKKQFTLGERDNYLTKIESQIEAKRNLLLEKRKILKRTVKENQFLDGVKNDYEKYHTFIVNQKQNQIKAMSLLNNYIGDIMVSGKLTEQDIKNSKEEQKEIIGQIEKIKKDLDEIMRD